MAGTIVNVSTIKNTVKIDTSEAMKKLKALKKELRTVNQKLGSTKSKRSPRVAELAQQKKDLKDFQQMQDAVSKDNLRNIKRENAERRKALGRRETTRLGTKRFEMAGLSVTDSSLRSLNKRFHDTQMSVREYNMELSNMIRQQRNAQRSTVSFNQRMKDLRSTFVALTASMTAFAAGADIVRAGQTLERLDIALKAVFGDADKAAKEMAFFNSVVDETGVNLIGATKGFKNFIASSKGANFNMEEARNIFKSVSKASVALGVSVDDTEGNIQSLVPDDQ